MCIRDRRDGEFVIKQVQCMVVFFNGLAGVAVPVEGVYQVIVDVYKRQARRYIYGYLPGRG